MDPSTTSQPDGYWYEIRVQGRLARRWAAWLDGMAVTPGDGGTTVIRGRVTDQPALHGLLARFRDLGVQLISVNPVDPVGRTARTAPRPPSA